ncbi:hypothetical protein AC579_5352 [Pseudocercospora musae]|uniref:Uncharacterized protein n=1 Tax=Pseudocercospora musae TaxID=113226 RepID=A0A139ISY1_9PEZI|nr:hypothetical protein AC579_5352 [Pseudocercospora musae]
MVAFALASFAPCSRFAFTRLPQDLLTAIGDIRLDESGSNSRQGQPSFFLRTRRFLDKQIAKLNIRSHAYMQMIVKAHRREGRLIVIFLGLKGDTKLDLQSPSRTQMRNAVKKFTRASRVSFRMTLQVYIWDGCQRPLHVIEELLVPLTNATDIDMHWENNEVGFDYIHYTYHRNTPHHEWKQGSVRAGPLEDACVSCNNSGHTASAASSQSSSPSNAAAWNVAAGVIATG